MWAVELLNPKVRYDFTGNEVSPESEWFYAWYPVLGLTVWTVEHRRVLTN